MTIVNFKNSTFWNLETVNRKNGDKNITTKKMTNFSEIGVEISGMKRFFSMKIYEIFEKDEKVTFKNWMLSKIAYIPQNSKKKRK